MSLPDKCSLFKLIILNDLDGLRSLLTPLTLHDRRYVVSKMIDRKPLLFHACELGFKDIVKYLLDECGADIEHNCSECSQTGSAMNIVMRMLDMGLMLILLRRYFPINSSESLNRVRFLLQNEYYSKACIWGLYQKNTGSPVLLLWRQMILEIQWVVFLSGPECYIERSGEFLEASGISDLVRMNLLLTCGLDTTLRNDEENNALCFAIVENQKIAERFLVEKKIYSPKCYAEALEFSGAEFIIFAGDFQRGVDCWKRSIRIRRDYAMYFECQSLTILMGDLHVKSQTEEQMFEFEKSNEENILLEALIVFIRQLPQYNQVLERAFDVVTQKLEKKRRFMKQVKILSNLYKFPIEKFRSTSEPLLTASFIINTLLFDNGNSIQ